MSRNLRHIPICAAILIALILWSCSGPKPTTPVYTELNWVGTEALYGTTPKKKDLSLLFVLVDWCGYCKRLKSETLTDPDVIQKLGESFNIAQINGESTEETPYMDTTMACRDLAHLYGVRGYPTIIVLDRSGEYLEIDAGFKDADDFLDMLDRILQTY